LNIGFVANSGFNLYNYRLSLMERFRSQGFTIYCICPEDKYTQKLRDKGFQVYTVSHLNRRGTNPLKERKLYKEYLHIYDQCKLDVAMQYTIKPNIYGTMAAKKLGVQTICNVTGLGYTFINNGLVSKISKQLYRMAFKRADKIVFQNHDDAALFIEEKIADRDKVHICFGSGINIEKFNPSFNNAEVYEGEEEFHFLLIARLLKDKGIFEYIESAKRIKEKFPNIVFSIAGDIDSDNPASLSKDEFKHMIKDNPDINYLGYINDTRSAICNADCLVLPSYREGLPRVILEGYAMGKPCIISDVPGCSQLVQNEETGLLVRIASSDSLTNGLERFVSMKPEQIKEMGRKARKLTEDRYSDGSVYEFYKKLLAQ
jgi:glycosyltransferase involved in cell wall biosynthesis